MRCGKIILLGVEAKRYNFIFNDCFLQEILMNIVCKIILNLYAKLIRVWEQ